MKGNPINLPAFRKTNGCGQTYGFTSSFPGFQKSNQWFWLREEENNGL